ncbi:hypothetical protein F5887DRAFT_236203 [Amanita rubescens]|nr:hypothetical protein F5887DRAFT_236203 [Amanita rubescens]
MRTFSRQYHAWAELNHTGTPVGAPKPHCAPVSAPWRTGRCTPQRTRTHNPHLDRLTNTSLSTQKAIRMSTSSSSRSHWESVRSKAMVFLCLFATIRRWRRKMCLRWQHSCTSVCGWTLRTERQLRSSLSECLHCLVMLDAYLLNKSQRLVFTILQLHFSIIKTHVKLICSSLRVQHICSFHKKPGVDTPTTRFRKMVRRGRQRRTMRSSSKKPLRLHCGPTR